jgi:Flp pilus assembly protein TadB
VSKTRLEDLIAINRRSGGLAEKILETPQTVLANRSKARVRSEKDDKPDLVVKI